MLRRHYLTVISLFAYFVLLCPNTPVFAELYKYKDEKGVWHFTDTPSPVAGNLEKVGSGGDSVPSGSDLKSVLGEKIKPRNDIEKAAMATVLVKSPMGTGSGFFISSSGYILTNRHVLYGDEKMVESMKSRYEKGEALLEEYRLRLDQDKKNIEAAREELDIYRQKVEKIPDPAVRSARMQRYEAELAKIESFEREYGLRKDEYERVKGEVSSEHSQLSSSSASSHLAKSFDITLADGSSMTAELIEASKNHDLALLKVSGIKNAPVLTPGNPLSLAQGARVFAIGNPIDLRNSVADGIISGFEGNFVKTSAKIYPGNSGGPLVEESGRVIGINTMKMITHKFEGLGFAIRIDVAMKEFSDYIAR